MAAFRMDLSKVVESAGSGPGGRLPSWSEAGPQGVAIKSMKGWSRRCSVVGNQSVVMNLRATLTMLVY